jgi:hypothetical protein
VDNFSSLFVFCFQYIDISLVFFTKHSHSFCSLLFAFIVITILSFALAGNEDYGTLFEGFTNIPLVDSATTIGFKNLPSKW